MNTKTVPLATFPNEFEARLIVQRLQNEGIPSFVKPLGGGYGGLGTNQFMPHRVYVAQEQLARAQAIADGRDPDEPAGEHSS